MGRQQAEDPWRADQGYADEEQDWQDREQVEVGAWQEELGEQCFEEVDRCREPGKIVSKSRSARGKKNWANSALKKWIDAVSKARKALKVTGFCAANGKTTA